ncbi:hypothetical protein D3C72_1234350 [compost metagenome]
MGQPDQRHERQGAAARPAHPRHRRSDLPRPIPAPQPDGTAAHLHGPRPARPGAGGDPLRQAHGRRHDGLRADHGARRGKPGDGAALSAPAWQDPRQHRQAVRHRQAQPAAGGTAAHHSAAAQAGDQGGRRDGEEPRHLRSGRQRRGGGSYLRAGRSRLRRRGGWQGQADGTAHRRRGGGPGL